MLRPEGYASITEADGTISQEYDTFTCGHKNEIVRVKVGMVNEAPRCLTCMRRICLSCQREANLTLKCIPFEKRLEAMESRDRTRRSMLE